MLTEEMKEIVTKFRPLVYKLYKNPQCLKYLDVPDEVARALPIIQDYLFCMSTSSLPWDGHYWLNGKEIATDTLYYLQTIKRATGLVRYKGNGREISYWLFKGKMIGRYHTRKTR